MTVDSNIQSKSIFCAMPVALTLLRNHISHAIICYWSAVLRLRPKVTADSEAEEALELNDTPSNDQCVQSSNLKLKYGSKSVCVEYTEKNGTASTYYFHSALAN
jgi:hypothetical protein